jgi:hypothetical protein
MRATTWLPILATVSLREPCFKYIGLELQKFRVARCLCVIVHQRVLAGVANLVANRKLTLFTEEISHLTSLSFALPPHHSLNKIPYNVRLCTSLSRRYEGHLDDSCLFAFIHVINSVHLVHPIPGYVFCISITPRQR